MATIKPNTEPLTTRENYLIKYANLYTKFGDKQASPRMMRSRLKKLTESDVIKRLDTLLTVFIEFGFEKDVCLDAFEKAVALTLVYPHHKEFVKAKYRSTYLSDEEMERESMGIDVDKWFN